MKLHKLLFTIFLLFLPFQTRILYFPETSYVSWYFNYHLAYFFYFTDILLIACFTAWLIFDPPKIANFWRNSVIWLTLAFLAISLLSLFHVKHIGLGIYSSVKWLEFILIVIYIYSTYIKSSDFSLSIMVLFISGIFQAVIAWIQFHVQHGVGLKWLGEYIAPLGTPGLANVGGDFVRSYGTMPHPNVLAGFLLLGLICGLYLCNKVNQGNIKWVSVIFGLFLISIGLFTTFSRLAWLAAVAAIISFLIYYFWKHQKHAAWGILLAVIVSCATIGIFYQSNLHTRVSDPSTVSVDDRKFFNHLGLNLAKENLMLGVGVGNYVPVLIDTKDLEAWQYQPPHNIFIFVLAELGMIGLILFISILADIFRKLKNVKWEPMTFSIAILSILFLFIAMFDHYFVTIQQGRLMFAVVLGLIAALPNLREQITNSK